ncbi:MAG: bifunctional proline dehydrogenase/L-glutamate gamma-semialdehyde dehydrogenase PutA [Proteobacteria bacterium]|nr:bifunctional proline dehydrogenase/L-glutamate gamma-semialdehyde dehydrogenase PutA [Pseudomonadota bacterium]
MPTKKDNPILSISAHAFAPEKTCVDRLLSETQSVCEHYDRDFTKAAELVKYARSREGNMAEGFIRQYGLNTAEGIAIMCLAEALLRIPDKGTADALIQDKFKDAKFKKHLGKSPSLLVNASTWGLMLSGGVVGMGVEESALSNVFAQVVNRLGEPVIRESLKHAMALLGNQFVMGETITLAIKRSAALAKEGYIFSFDMLGEGARSEAQAEHYLEAYLHAVKEIGKSADKKLPIAERSGISVKLSALYPRYELIKKEDVFKTLLPRLKHILLSAAHAGIPVSMDAEESYRLDLSLMLFEELQTDPDLRSYTGFGFVLQAYQKRAPYVLEWLIALAEKTKRKIPVRLVKGAYWDSEIKRSQELGLSGYPVYTRKSYTDVAYLACAKKMFEHPETIYPQFATHNALTIATILTLSGGKKFEFQRLHGMGKDFYTPLMGKVPCRIYAPVGRHEELLAYLIRRLLENGANNSFVNIASQKSTPLDELLKDPVEKAISRGGHPHPRILLPADILPDRKNSSGTDLGNLAALTDLQYAIEKYFKKTWLAGSGKKAKSVATPFDPSHTIGTVAEVTSKEVDSAFSRASAVYDAWKNRDIEERATLLLRTADLLEEHKKEAIALTMLEAGKVLSDAIGEVREAIDFCRYYAAEATTLLAPKTLPGPTGERNILRLHPRGTWVAISPWNFPFAIFTGQIAAALVTGNTVIAKPAEQTPLIAAFMTKLFHQAGVPDAVLQLLPGDGATVGAALVKHKDTAGVVFTGSVETARLIQRSLSEKEGPIVPLIAETGGLNAMIVDSSCLPEQVVDDIVTSAFNSAGQRCSALRVLLVQKEIAKPLTELLKGALALRKVGSPLEYDTDIGPVIDKDAMQSLNRHIAQMKKDAKIVFEGKAPKEGFFVAPHVFEIPSFSTLKKEVFGPVLHIVKYDAGKLDHVLDEINASGYGLTLGIHTRIVERAEYIRNKVNVGNIYVNRSQIGAVVGVQPFGGEGLSGTGPKAGGPHYLVRFCTEQTYTVNTAAVGGNVELLS